MAVLRWRMPRRSARSSRPRRLLRRLADGDINFVSVLQSCKDTVVGAAMNEAIAALPSLGLPEFQPMQAQAARFVGLWAGVTVRA